MVEDILTRNQEATGWYGWGRCQDTIMGASKATKGHSLVLGGWPGAHLWPIHATALLCRMWWSRQEMSLGKWCWCQDTIVAHDSQGQSGLRVVNIFEETLKKISLRSSFIKPGLSSIIKPEREDEYCWKDRRPRKLSKLKKVNFWRTYNS